MIRCFRIKQHVLGGILASPLNGGKQEFISNSRLRVVDAGNGIVVKARHRRRRMDRPMLNDGSINIHIKSW